MFVVPYILVTYAILQERNKAYSTSMWNLKYIYIYMFVYLFILVTHAFRSWSDEKMKGVRFKTVLGILLLKRQPLLTFFGQPIQATKGLEGKYRYSCTRSRPRC
jgi:hypothetical protein